MIINERIYNSLQQEIKQMAKKYAFGQQLNSWVDNFGFELHNKLPSLISIELTNEIQLLIDNNEKYNKFKLILNKIPKFSYFCDIGDLYSLWQIIYIKCFEPVIIIGAGVSGLTIASNINKQDKPVLVLEARDRIGGRVFTNDNNMDMGAAWLHGSENNPLNELIDFNNLIPVSKCNPWMHSENTPIEYMSSDGNISEDKRQQMATKWNELATKIGNIPNKTIIEAYKQIINDTREVNESKRHDNDDTDLLSFLYMIEVWCGGSIKNISTSFLNINVNVNVNDIIDSIDKINYTSALFGDYGGSHYIFKNGAKSLIDAIINTSTSISTNRNLYDNIKCNQIVTNIIYNDYYVEVHTSNGQIYCCDKLCITIPPGPLRNIQFNPPLDNAHINALSKLKMGSYKKIQMEFYPNDIFWNETNNSPMFLTHNSKNNGNNYYLNESKVNSESESKSKSKNDIKDQDQDQCPYILWNNYKFSKNKPFLEAICPANIGWSLTGKPDEEIIDMMMTQLRNYYPIVPDPKA